MSSIAGVGHHLGLAEFLAGDAPGAGGDLKFCQQRALVGLDMRPVGDAGRIAGGLNPRDVALDPVHVDDGGGRAVFAGDFGGEGSGHGSGLFNLFAQHFEFQPLVFGRLQAPSAPL